MHAILLTRGINQSMEIWKTFMQAQMFDWKRRPLIKDKDGKFIQEGVDSEGHPIYQKGPEEYTIVQGALRPMQLWEYVFPKESLQEVIAMQDQIKSYDKLRPEVAKIAWLARKAMGAKKMPDMPDLKAKEPWQITKKYVPMHGIGCYFLGIREDKEHDFIFKDPNGFEVGYNQEGL